MQCGCLKENYSQREWHFRRSFPSGYIGTVYQNISWITIYLGVSLKTAVFKSVKNTNGLLGKKNLVRNKYFR